MPIELTAELAQKYFTRGLNCAQSVLRTVAEIHGYDTGNLDSVAAGFGGGISRLGGPCGAFTGAVMALGIALKEQPNGDELRDTVQRLHSEFEREYNSTLCRELTECDLTTEEGQKKFDDPGRRLACEGYVRFCARWVDDELRKTR
jgi:C_GCAxxG_C_C family probable redox protein